MAKKSGLGKGISALMVQTTEEVFGDEPSQNIEEITIDAIHPNPNQPRRSFDEADLEELTQSIRELGILQPVIVRPDSQGYQIIAGERRYQAAKRAGLEKLPVIVREMDDTTTLEVALIENIQRSNLNSIEEACAYKELMERTGMTQEALAKKLAKSRSAIANALRLLDLPQEVQQFVVDGLLSAGHARAILGVPSPEKRIMIAQKVVDEKLSVRQTESLVALFSVEQADKSPRPVLPNSFKKAARQLRQELSTNVKIKQVRGKYKIEIEFADQDELDRLVDLMKSQ